MTPPEPATPPAASRVVMVAGHALRYRVRRSARARAAFLQITPRHGLEVVLPRRAPLSTVSDLLRDQRRWLARHTDGIQRAGRPPPPLRSGARLPVRGQWLPLVIGAGRTARVQLSPQAIMLCAPQPQDEEAVRAQIGRWYRRFARRVLQTRVAMLREAGDRPVARITVRDQRSRWASCSGDLSDRSAAGMTLNFNWRLVMAPPPVLDAVVAHELVHLSIPDHSPRFWRALDRRFPGHRACRRWLDYNAYRLGF